MPTYEYLCSACSHHWEAEQKISEPALEDCPACQKKTAKRQISGGRFILKGGGWYSDLYSSPKPADSKGSDSKKAGDAGAASGGEKKESSKSEGSTTTTTSTSSDKSGA